MVDKVRRLKHKILYKQAEFAAISKLTSIKPTEKTKNIGYLKRLKEKLEFRISTEASSLSAEKDLIRRINEVNDELEKAIKSYKMKKKVELVKGDIEQATKEIEEEEKIIAQSNKVLDDLYSKLRSLTGYRGERRQGSGEKRETKHQKPQEVSLWDMAMMQKEGAKESEIEVSSN